MTAIDWRDAVCKDEDPDLFHPVLAGRAGGAIADQARRICLRCPIRQRCLDWALDTGDDWAILGGHTADERRRIKRHRKREAEVTA